MENELNRCVFCGELKEVSRFYIHVKNKHFDDNKRGKYSTYIYYCNDCGVEPLERISEETPKVFTNLKNVVAGEEEMKEVRKKGQKFVGDMKYEGELSRVTYYEYNGKIYFESVEKVEIEPLQNGEREEWEKKFDYKFCKLDKKGESTEIGFCNEKYLPRKVKDFIRDLLSQSKKESYAKGWEDSSTLISLRENSKDTYLEEDEIEELERLEKVEVSLVG